MATTAYADPAALFGNPLPKMRRPLLQHTMFGDVAILAFLFAQCFDGIFTYVGVSTFGLGVEANPLIAGLMATLEIGRAHV